MNPTRSPRASRPAFCAFGWTGRLVDARNTATYRASGPRGLQPLYPGVRGYAIVGRLCGVVSL